MDRKQLGADMKYLRQHYRWTDTDVVDIREAAKQDASWWAYWRGLASMWRQVEGAA